MGKKNKKPKITIDVPARGYVPTSHEFRRVINELNDFIIALDQEKNECDKLLNDCDNLRKDRDFYHEAWQKIHEKHETQKQRAENLSFWLPFVSVFAIGCLIWMSAVLTIYLQK